MFEIAHFLSHEKTMLIAPAGYGKTHSIAASMDYLKSNGKHLILTHTHAGIASIKEKLKKENIPSASFHVETISGFAQRYVLSFHKESEIPEVGSTGYFGFILQKAMLYFSLRPIQKILLRTYSSLFVDEYQDCTNSQHQLILLISSLFPTRFLGDPMQGIFQFHPDDLLVDMENESQMAGFFLNRYELKHPQRWSRGNNASLGEDLKAIRGELLSRNPINLDRYAAIENYCFNEDEIYSPGSPYYSKVSYFLNRDNLLIIHPTSTSINPRLSLIKKFKNRFTLLESIDDKDFYNLAGEFDNIPTGQSLIVIKKICLMLFNKTELDKWINSRGLVRKKDLSDEKLSQDLKVLVDEYDKRPSFLILREIMLEVHKLPNLKCYRKEVFNCLCKALQYAESENVSVGVAMIEIRNMIRRYGKKTNVKCIGTTLLTKGLEFDTVLILNAHQFTCPKHLYVAFTRACKKLIVFSNSKILRPGY